MIYTFDPIAYGLFHWLLGEPPLIKKGFVGLKPYNFWREKRRETNSLLIEYDCSDTYRLEIKDNGTEAKLSAFPKAIKGFGSERLTRQIGKILEDFFTLKDYQTVEVILIDGVLEDLLEQKTFTRPKPVEPTPVRKRRSARA